jgi:hypothetical protein
MTNVTETLTLNQKTIEALHKLNGNAKTKQLVRDSELVIEYYKQERVRYISENKDENIEGLNKFALNELNDMLVRVQKEVFNG